MALTVSYSRANIKAETLNTKEALHERVRSSILPRAEPRSDRHVDIGRIVGRHRFPGERDVEPLSQNSLTECVVHNARLRDVRWHYPCFCILDRHFG